MPGGFLGSRRGLLVAKKPVVAAGGGGFLTYTDSRVDGGTGQTITYNSGGNPSCGAADANRIVVVAMGRRADTVNPIAGVTIGGVTATQATGAGYFDNIMQVDIWYAAVPTGTTCAVVVDWGVQTFATDSCIFVYRLITTTPTPTATTHANTPSGNISLGPYSVPSGGGSVNFWANRDDTGATSPFVNWTNTSAAHGDAYATSALKSFSGSIVLSAGNPTVTISQNGSAAPDVNSAAAASWGP